MNASKLLARARKSVSIKSAYSRAHEEMAATATMATAYPSGICAFFYGFLLGGLQGHEGKGVNSRAERSLV